MKLTLLGRRECGLCEDAARDLSRLGYSFESVDIDADPALRARYNESIPVLLADGVEICRAPLSFAGLRSALERVTLGSGR
jgi:glutaredoxin